MSIYDEVKKAFEQTLKTNKKRVKLKLDFNASPSKEKYYTLINYEISERDQSIKVTISDNGEVHSVQYLNILSLDFADNDERLKIWIDSNDQDPQRLYLFYTDVF
ncbi:hypothetical protein ACDZ28_04505 [Paenibacillus sp. RS8]|uniref:hypothetical protein n=1 Tax=Paenibacillus sp. RS8 TaxID=3242681 RepID=UPI0035C15A81